MLIRRFTSNLLLPESLPIRQYNLIHHTEVRRGLSTELRSYEVLGEPGDLEMGVGVSPRKESSYQGIPVQLGDEAYEGPSEARPGGSEGFPPRKEGSYDITPVQLRGT